MNVEYGLFIWNYEKEKNNINKHGIDFFYASRAFKDSKRLITIDEKKFNL